MQTAIMQTAILEATIPRTSRKLPTEEWIVRELLIKTSISKENACSIAKEVRDELSGIESAITNNLIKSICCLKLQEHNLLKEQSEFVRTKRCYEAFEPAEA